MKSASETGGKKDRKDRKEREWRVWQAVDQWTAQTPDGEPVAAPSLAEVVEAIPKGQSYELCLPQSYALFTEAEFPKVEKDELLDMIRLQTERLFCLTDQECSVAIGRTEEREEDLWVTVWAVSHQMVKDLLGDIRRLPRTLILHADTLASREGGDRLLMFREGGEIVAALIVRGELAWSSNFSAELSAEERDAEVRRVSMGLALEMPQAEPERVVFAEGAEEWAASWSQASGLPYDRLPTQAVHAPARIVWTPAPWRAAAQSGARKRWVKAGGIALVALYLLFIGWQVVELVQLNNAANQLTARQAKIAPVVQQIAEAKSTWNRVAAVTERRRSPLEILDGLRKLLPPEGLLLTKLEVRPDGFELLAEADAPALAFAFVEGIQDDPEWDFEELDVTSPSMVSNTKKWRVRINATGWR